jgi:membrane-associated phospholipid phosphatase
VYSAAWAAAVAKPGSPVAERRRRLALAAAGGCALGVVATGALGLALDAGRDRDAAMLHGFTGLDGSRVHSEIRAIALLADPVPYTLVGLLFIAVALARRRGWRASAAAIVLVGSGATTYALKHLTPQSRYEDWLFGDQARASWPSGHATAAMTLALCAVIVAAPAWRAATALAGCAYAVGLAYATLALTWHYPSDMFAGFFIAGLWVSVALAVLAHLEGEDPGPEPVPLFGWLGAVGGAGALVATAMVWVASGRAPIDAADRATAAACALALAALALTLVVVTVVVASEGEANARRDLARPRLARRRVAS